MSDKIKSGDLVRFDFSEISSEIFKLYLAPIVSSDKDDGPEWVEIEQGEIGVVVSVKKEGVAHVLFGGKNKVVKIFLRRLQLIDPSSPRP
jgi:hypothetical protein